MRTLIVLIRREFMAIVIYLIMESFNSETGVK